MKRLSLRWLFCLAASCIIVACVEREYNNFPDPGGNTDGDSIETVEEKVVLNEQVLNLGPELADCIRIIDENTLWLSGRTPATHIPDKGQLIYYHPETTCEGMFAGLVKSVGENDGGWLISTEIPPINDIFRYLSINLEMNSSNTQVEYEPSDEDCVKSCTIVDNSIWDDIEEVYSDADSPARTGSRIKSENKVPLDLTLEFAVSNNNEVFEGKIYLGLKGYVYLSDMSDFAMDVNMRIGLNGTLGTSVSGERVFNLLQLKNGITLYSNKLIGLRWKPSLDFFTKGQIRVEAGLNFEMMNTDIKLKYASKNFVQSNIEREHDNYFRVHSLKSEGAFGLSLTGKLYAFIFSDNFFSGGVSNSVSIQFQGEKNVGIQFPDFVNFDFSVSVIPEFTMQPFVAFRKVSGLVRHLGPSVSVKANAFTIDLIPNIHNIKYRQSKDYSQLKVDAEIYSKNTSFIESKQEGIALFRKGEEEPVGMAEIKNENIKSIEGNAVFELNRDTQYEIAPYMESIYDGYVYGERINVERPLREILEEFYRSTDGDNWINNENWCTDAPLNEWYGLSFQDDSDPEPKVILSLEGNNLAGDAYLAPNNSIININLNENQLTSLTVEDCTSLLKITCDDNPAETISLAGCRSLKDFYFSQYSGNTKTLTGLNVSGCSNLESLLMGNNMLRNLDISGCANLRILLIENNMLTNLDVSDCPNIEMLIIDRNMLETLDLTGLAKLNQFVIGNNPLHTVRLSGCNSLESFGFEGGKLEVLEISDCSNLKELLIRNNKLTTLNIVGCNLLTTIYVPDNQLETLDLSGLISLENVFCYGNPLQRISLSGCKNLKEFFFYQDDGIKTLKAVDLSGCISLEGLDIQDNLLTTLDVSGFSRLEKISVENNRLANLSLSGCTALKEINISGNQLTSIDLSDCRELQSLICNDNPINSLITSFYQNIEHFDYDRKYTDYYYDADGILHYTTHQYGWWYAGEPAKGYHGR